jgi:hypothetical protein
MLWNGNECGKTKVMRISREPSSSQFMTEQRELENVEYFNYWSSVITDNARCMLKIKSRFAMARAAFS